jgi:hypothetical protein
VHYIFSYNRNLNIQQVNLSVTPSLFHHREVSNTTFDAARHSISGVSPAISLNIHHNTNESGNYMS